MLHEYYYNRYQEFRCLQNSSSTPDIVNMSDPTICSCSSEIIDRLCLISFDPENHQRAMHLTSS